MSKVYLTCNNIEKFTREYYIAAKQVDKRISQRYLASKRAKKYNVLNTLTLNQWLAVLIDSEGICFYCHIDVGVENLGIDHVVPMCRGGANSIENIVPSCIDCNCKKNAKLPDNLTIERLLARQISF